MATRIQWCIAKNGGGYTQRGVAKGLKVPCLFMITEVSIRCQKNPEVGIQRIPPNTPLVIIDSAVLLMTVIQANCHAKWSVDPATFLAIVYLCD